MAIIPVFGTKQFCKCLTKLGFEIFDNRGKGGHKLAKHPTKKPQPDRQIRNITIPHTQTGTYDDPRFRKTLIKQVCAFGYTEKEVLENL